MLRLQPRAFTPKQSSDPQDPSPVGVITPVQQHLLVSLHDRPDPLLYKGHQEGTVLQLPHRWSCPTHSPGPQQPPPPPGCFSLSSEQRSSGCTSCFAPTFLQVPRDGADNVGRVALVLSHRALGKEQGPQG